MKLVIVLLEHHFLHTLKYKMRKSKYVARTKFYSFNRVEFGSFCFVIKYLHIFCRGPPVQFEKQIKLNGGKKNGTTP